jgi:hypothetical protein
VIISHQHKYIFFAVPKTATHSIRDALRLSKGIEDWEQQMLFGSQSLPIDGIAKIGHGHISAREIEPVLAPDQWEQYFKFAFVRNPFDRFVSACAFLNRHNPQFKQRPNEWMKVAMSRAQFRQRVLIRPQYEQLINVDDELALDFVGRYETLQDSLNHILDHLSLPKALLEVHNQSDHYSYRHYYDDALMHQVKEFYKQDLDTFGYCF